MNTRPWWGVVALAAMVSCSKTSDKPGTNPSQEPIRQLAVDSTWWRMSGGGRSGEIGLGDWLSRHPRLRQLPQDVRSRLTVGMGGIERLNRDFLFQPGRKDLKPVVDAQGLASGTAPSWQIPEEAEISSGGAV